MIPTRAQLRASGIRLHAYTARESARWRGLHSATRRMVRDLALNGRPELYLAVTTDLRLTVGQAQDLKRYFAEGGGHEIEGE